MSILEFREKVLQEWKQHDPYLEDIEGFREFFNKRFHEKIIQEEKRVEDLFKPRGWLKRLRELDSPSQRVRLIDRIYREILVKGEDFSEDRKDEFQEGIELLSEIMMIHGAYTEEVGQFGDMWGEYILEYGRLNPKLGQFFTPITVCDFMVKMLFSIGDLKGKPKKILDPAAGCGRFMLRTAKFYAEEVGMFNFLFYNIDIDFRMYVCCTMNAILNGIPSINIWGDSLSLECREGVVTIPLGNLAMWKRIDGEKAKSLLVVEPKTTRLTVTQPIYNQSTEALKERERRERS